MMCLGENSTSNASWKSVVGVPDQFPAGMRVLVVDDEPICLRILEKMLRNCHYEVTKCSGAVVALKLLRDNRDGFDIVISDVHMPDMDGFKLLEHVELEMDLPVIMMSADDNKLVVMKGVTHGACDYLIKPVRMEELKNIWQHVVRRKKHEWKEKDLEQSGSVEDGEPQQKPCGDADHSSSANDGNLKNSRKRKDEEDEVEDKDDTSTLKKPRVVWSVELHEQFVAAVNQLGIDKAVPKKILEVMNVPGLTRENVASHLQKYRVYLRRICEQPQNGLGYSFMGPQDSPFGLNGLGFQALASSGQISAQSLATIQAATFTRATNGSRVDQQNIFRFADPNISFLDGQQQNNNGRRGNLLHGIPTNKDSKQLAALHHSAHPFGNVHVNVNSQSGQSNSLLTQLVQPQSRIQMFVRSQSRTQILNEVGSSHALNLPSSVGQPSLSQAIPAAVLSRYGIDNVPALPHASLSQPTSGVEISRNQGMDLPGNTIPLTINSGMPKEILPQELTSEMKVFRSFPPNFEVFNDLNQNRTGYWDLPNVRSSFETSQQGSGDVAPSVLVQPELPSDQTRHIRTTYINKPAFSVASGLGYSTNLGQPEMGFQNSPFSDQFGQQDLMTTLVKQQQGVVPVDDEFRLDDYHLDYLPF